ncbi:MAG: SOS response-associated peptidase [Fimbriimonas sp.]
MCARFSLVTPVAELASYFEAGVDPEIDIPPRANVAPTLDVPAVIEDEKGRRIKVLKWGLVPYWSQDSSTGTKLINARAESALEKPAFREPFRKRRCIIPATGFYEWRDESDELTLDFGLDPSPNSKTKKQPYFFHQRDGHPMALAGLWDRWKDASGHRIETFTILTTDPNEVVKDFHDRMPCILAREDVNFWLDEKENPESLLPLLRSFPEAEIAVEKADPRLNNVRFEPCSL